MNRHRTTIILTSLLLSGALLLPAAAPAGTMLSGYGGPGAGDQAILGSTLVGGAGGGSTGSSSGSGGSQSQGGATGAVGARAHGTPARKRSAAAREGSKGSHRLLHTSNPPAAAYSEPTGSRPQAALADASNSEPLGLSGSNLIIILIVAGGLVLTGGLTRRLARTPS